MLGQTVKENLNESPAYPGRNAERPAERQVEKADQVFERTNQAVPAPVFIPQPTATPSVQRPAVSERQKQIEAVLEEDLGELYFQLPPASQAQFKVQGEATARQIDGLLSSLKFTVSQIASVIRSWLSAIPGVNKFFLEQETKIKTDKIIERFK